MKIHLFTRAKGGIGMTRCGINLSFYYLLPTNNKLVRRFEDIHKGNFGENTLWKKIKEFESIGVI